jgi:hypothetical protein
VKAVFLLIKSKKITMTYEERQNAICKECTDYNTSKCPYVIRSLRCPNLSNQMDGWELGYKDAVDKVCEYLKANYEDIGIRYIRGYKIDNEIEIFKKYMEEQQ